MTRTKNTGRTVKMEIGLIDVDGRELNGEKFPNLALMKISAYEKSQGNSVEWWNGLKHYDRVYQAKVFDSSYTPDNDFCIQADEVIKGGTGYGLNDKLPDEIEHIYPDYGIYGITDTAYGFLTRGCPRHCKFCIVGDKEGLKSNKVADLDEFWHGQKNIEILDPNILACKDRIELLDELIDSDVNVNFNQGLDARFVTKEVADRLNAIKGLEVHFAWDNYEYKTRDKLKEIRPWLKLSAIRTVVYVLTNFNTTHEQDLERVYTLRDMGYNPYVMIYDKPHAPAETRHLQRWCNNRRIFWQVKDFNDYNKEEKQDDKQEHFERT